MAGESHYVTSGSPRYEKGFYGTVKTVHVTEDWSQPLIGIETMAARLVMER